MIDRRDHKDRGRREQFLAGLAEPDLAVEPPEPASDLLVGEEPTGAADKPHSLWTDAWWQMRRRPMFWISTALIIIFAVMAVWPSLFTSLDPRYCLLAESRQPPGRQHWFGTDIQGCDVYARTVYGARSSILVGVFATLGVTVIGSFVGLVSGYFGHWLDVLLSRLGEIFFAIPTLLGGIVILYSFPSKPDTPYFVVVGKVVLAITLLAWPSIARLMRGSVLQVMPNEYVVAAQGLGASSARVIVSHVLPNAMAGVIAVATINLGVYIALEATLSFLGIGLQEPAISWGIAISAASKMGYITSAPHMLLFPSLFLSLTVLAFIMLGEVARDALDPKLR
ncbi:MAG: ABC transporter permease [Propionibacteriaceae bacterium]|jgi:oligopeptide transport system permease protein|nr:ABC transporter permease [Propionibacteriaceae bacterium]